MSERERPGPGAARLGASCPLPIVPQEAVVLGHGGGGRLTSELIERLFLPLLDDPHLRQAEDSAVLEETVLPDGSTLAISTDAHVVQPLFFPGGDIGRLAACGTINDLAMVGARPLALAVAFVLEEGLPTEDLARAVRSLRAAADEAGVPVVTGDTKVAERGKVDGLYVTTTGIGLVPAGRRARADGLRPGDAVLVSGPLERHVDRPPGGSAAGPAGGAGRLRDARLRPAARGQRGQARGLRARSPVRRRPRGAARPRARP